ncbi:uncharacterized protein [Nicotiana tomentosiformis]|uniref:uncharacterized protein n=1 Tax=Nicotiana tomentosiformis TaxID=4098 RepID=UPI00388C7B2F
MASAGNERLPIYEPRKGNYKKEVRKWGKFVPKSERNEAMNVNTSPVKFTTKVSKKQSMKCTSFQDKTSGKLTLKEMQEKEYSFMDSDVPAIFEEFLELNLIELTEMKRPNEAGKMDDPNYYKYHRLGSHPLEKCFFFKDKVMDLACEKKIVLEYEKASANHVSITFGSFSPDEFCSFKESKYEELLENNKVEHDQYDDDEGWTLIFRDDIEASYCNADKGEENSDDLLLAPSSEYLIESIPQEVNACEEKVTFTNDDLLLGDTLHNCPLYLISYMCDERSNRIVVDGGSSVNILLICTVKEFGIQTRGQRAIGAIRLGITIEDMQSSAWLHVSDAKTPYNVLLGRPWIYENKVVPSTYHQCLKYYEGEVEKKIVANDKPFIEVESHFADAKFYLKNCIVKQLKTDDGMKSKNDEPTTKRAEVTAGRAKAVTEEVQPASNKAYRGDIASYGKKELTLPVKRIEAVKLTSKPLARLFTKAGYNPNKPLKLGILPSEAATSKPREGENGVSSLMEDDEKLDDVSSCYHISFHDGDPQEDEDAKDAPLELEEGVKAMIDNLKEVNLGTDEEPRPTYLSALLEVDEESTYIALIKEFRDVFSWSYKEIPGLDHKVAVHHLTVKNGAHPVKQAQRCFRPDLVPLIETEVNKLIEAGFIREVKYLTWVSSIVPVRKKNGQIRVCVDFRDLNNACPKDEFVLPILELMIDATTRYEAMSFMYGSSGYNQIHMALKDEEFTAFHTPKGIYSYRVMPFGLKNVGATYQRVMQNIFDNLLHKNVECYVDDLVVKSRKRDDHLKDLRMLKHYFQVHVVRLVSKANPIKFVMSKHVLSDQLARWYLQFQQFEILYILQKAVKGQALADFLASHLILDDWELTDELPDEDTMVVEVQPPWKMYFDGAAHLGRAGAGVVFVTPQSEVLPYSFTLTQLCSNNVTDYQAIILGLEMAIDMKRLQLQVSSDSQLVINQLLGSYEVKKPELRPHHDYAKTLMGWVSDVTIQHVPRKENTKADA